MGSPPVVLSRPAIPRPIRVRRNIATLPDNDPIITFYRRAVGEMKTKPISDPLSWRYQAARHDYGRADDPFAAAGDALPSAAEQGRFWARCQHNSWYFLPWHRMYLHHFEKIIMDHVVRLGGPSDWALPYWNYTASDGAGRIPVPMRNATLADGSTNHLFVLERDARANRGEEFASAAQRDTAAAFSEGAFTAAGGAAGFGGPRTVFNHSGGPLGTLEGTPHGSMHMAVAGPPVFGGRRGFMANFTRAPLDPIFWLHHCNIDRLWDVWLRRDPSHTNPSSADWLTSVSFSFHDRTGAAVDMTPSQVIDTRADPLSYIYDDTTTGP